MTCHGSNYLQIGMDHILQSKAFNTKILFTWRGVTTGALHLFIILLMIFQYDLGEVLGPLSLFPKFLIGKSVWQFHQQVDIRCEKRQSSPSHHLYIHGFCSFQKAYFFCSALFSIVL